MAGTRNNTNYSAGYNLEPTTAADIVTMQLDPTSTQTINVPANPEGLYAANPGSIAEGRNGTLWLKVTGTGNTGWQQISTGTTVPIQFTSDFGVAIPSANNLNVAGFGTQGIYTLGSGDTVTINAYNATSTQKGVASFDATNFTLTSGAVASNPITINAGTGLSGGGAVNLGGSINISADSTVPLQFTTDDTLTATATSNNINVFGQNAGSIPVMDTSTSVPSTINIEDRSWTTPLVVDPSTTVGLRGTYSTIQSAINASVSGQTIFIRPGTYTENLTIDKSILIFTYSSSFRETQPTVIVGKTTISTGVSVKFNGITLQTNSDFILSLTGNGALIRYQNCFFNVTNNDAFQITGNNTTNCYLENCSGNFVSTYGLGSSSNGVLWIKNCFFYDNTSSSSGFLASAAACFIYNSIINIPFRTSGTGVIIASNCNFGKILTPYTNTTYITTAGSVVSYLFNCSIYSGTSSAINIGSGTILEAYNCQINSSNTNAITGAGTLKYAGLIFTGSSQGINTTTQTGGTLQGGLVQNPSAGYLGEVIQSSAINVACTNSTPVNITSISLTPGIWNISCNVQATNTGANVVRVFASISTTSATLSGNKGDQQIQNGSGAGAFDMSCTLADYRVVNTTTTTYYLVGRQDFGAGTGTLNGRITATRVG